MVELAWVATKASTKWGDFTLQVFFTLFTLKSGKSMEAALFLPASAWFSLQHSPPVSHLLAQKRQTLASH
jgi:hypothetical protein